MTRQESGRDIGSGGEGVDMRLEREDPPTSYISSVTVDAREGVFSVWVGAGVDDASLVSGTIDMRSGIVPRPSDCKGMDVESGAEEVWGGPQMEPLRQSISSGPESRG